MMNTKNNRKVIGAIVVATSFIFILQSCLKDNFELDKLAQTEYSPNLAAPLVYSSLTIQDILTNKDATDLITVDPTKFCTLVYKGNLFTFVASDLINIPNQTPAPYTSTLTAAQALALLPAGATVTISNSQTINFNSGTNNPHLDSIVFKQGDIAVSLNSDFKNNGQIVLTIPSAKKNGVVFSKTLPIVYSGTVPVVVNTNFDLTGYHFDMTNGGTAYNQFVVNMDISLTGSGIAPAATDKITFSQSIVNMKFDKIFGDIGQQQLSPNKDTVELSIFNNALNTGTFNLVDAKIYVTISNSYGVPINGTITQFDGYKPPAAPYAISGNPNPLPISSPTLSQMGQTLSNSYTLDNSNSNIVSVINNLPNFLIYKINSLTNPSGGSTHSNFVLDSSKFKVDLKVELPLYGTAKGFVLVDTLDFNFSNEVNDVEWALLRAYNSNGFPLDVNLQGYFVDSLYNKIDSIFKIQPLLKSGTLNSLGKVIAPSSTTEDARFTKAQLINIQKAKYILIRAKANTANAGTANVKIYSDYKLDVKLGIQVQLKKKI